MSKKILIVDDDQDFREAVALLLEAKGYEVIKVAEGSSGYTTAKKDKPNLILLDVMMTHNTEGFEIAQKLHSDSDTRNIPIILVTGISKETNVPFKYEPDEIWLPVKEVLEKPVKPEVLLRAVEKSIS